MSELASPAQLRMSYLRIALVVVPLVLLLGTLSGVLSGSGADNPWYAALRKPAATPPGWVFPIVWSALYALIGFAFAAILAARGAAGRGVAIALFAGQLALNLAWSPIFFAAHRPGIALAVLLAMIALTVATVLAFARIRRRAAWAMLPYLAWIAFAAWLNHRIDVLNPHAEVLAPAAVSTQIDL